MSVDARIAPLRYKVQSLRTMADPWYQEWQEIGWFMCPRKSNALMGGSAGAPFAWLGGRKQTLRALHQAGEWSSKLLASSLHGNLTNPALRWFGLTVRPEDLAEKPAVREWLDHASQVLFDELNRSNFTNGLS